MKFQCGRKSRLKREAAELKAAKLAQWHPWFAWHPVKVGQEDCRFWESVQRKQVRDLMSGCDEDGYRYQYYVYHWEYKA